MPMCVRQGEETMTTEDGKRAVKISARSLMAKHGTFNAGSEGSSPFEPTNF